MQKAIAGASRTETFSVLKNYSQWSGYREQGRRDGNINWRGFGLKIGYREDCAKSDRAMAAGNSPSDEMVLSARG